MAAITGVGGLVTFANGLTDHVKSWKINVKADVFKYGEFGGNGWKKALTGLKEWSGSYVVQLDQSTSLAIGDFAGASGTATFQFVSGSTLTGSVKVTGSDPETDVEGGPVSITITFEGDGALSAT